MLAPMRVTRMSVKNFRNLPSVSVPLSSGTVIVGENAVGKSNLMYALRLVLDPTLSPAHGPFAAKISGTVSATVPPVGSVRYGGGNRNQR